MKAEPTCHDALFSCLVAEGAITPTARGMIERFTARWQVTPFHALLMTELLSESELANALAKGAGLPRLYSLKGAALSEDLAAHLGFRRAREWEILPLKSEGGGAPELVCADPTRRDWIDELRQGLKYDFTLAVAERSDIVRAIDELYPLAAQLPSLYAK